MTEKFYDMGYNAFVCTYTTDQIIVCGFSAGGHLAGSLCVHWEDMTEKNPEYADVSDRPDAGILAYSVISSCRYAHRDSFVAFCGDNAPEGQLETAGNALKDGRSEDLTKIAAVLTGLASVGAEQIAAAAETHEPNPGAAA